MIAILAVKLEAAQLVMLPSTLDNLTHPVIGVFLYPAITIMGIKILQHSHANLIALTVSIQQLALHVILEILILIILACGRQQIRLIRLIKLIKIKQIQPIPQI